MLTVTARPWLSPGMSFTSIVPALSGRKTVRVMRAILQIPEAERAPQLDVAREHVQRRHRIDEVTRDEQVPREVGVHAVRIEPSVGRRARPDIRRRGSGSCRIPRRARPLRPTPTPCW